MIAKSGVRVAGGAPVGLREAEGELGLDLEKRKVSTSGGELTAHGSNGNEQRDVDGMRQRMQRLWLISVMAAVVGLLDYPWQPPLLPPLIPSPVLLKPCL